MRTSSTLFALSSLSLAFAAVDIGSIPRVSSANVVPGAFIVELDKANVLGRRGLAMTAHAALYRALDDEAADWSLQNEYDAADIFIGAAVTVGSDEDLLKLAQVPHVKSIKPVYLHPRPEPVSLYIPTGKDDPKVPVDTFSTHIMTGVDKLHAEGYFGNGVKIAVIDTGIDYLHPDLGKGFGPGFKVERGYDFVGDAYTGANKAQPDEDPMDCGGHGTHVAGIIGANLDATYNFSGVAPQASLGGYRVFGCSGSVADDVLIDAFIRAYKDGNDVLSLSLGGAQGWVSATTSVVASRIAAAGRIVSIAAGNDGSHGSWYASAPGTGVDVISVASVENTALIVQSVNLSNGHAPIPYYSFLPIKVNGSLPIYATSTDTTVVDDACNPLPETTPNLSGYLVVVRRGTCAFTQKIANIQAKGAKQALIYDNKDQALSGISVGEFPAVLITQADGKYLVSEFVAKSNVTVTFPQSGGEQTIKSPTGGLMSTFSSFGPDNDMYMKPAVAAPGGNILSTYPTAKGSFAVLSGTSMATPFLSGAAALLLEAQGKSDVTIRGARTRFQTTAANVPSTFTDGDPLQTVSQQGAGLINVYKAVHASTFISPGELLLNDTTHPKLQHTVYVKNTSKQTQIYTITHVAAGTATTMKDGQAIPAPVPLVKNAATVKFSTSTLKVNAGRTSSFSVSIKPPTGLDAKTFPVYGGFVKVTSATEDLQVTYVGVAAALKDMQVIDTSSTYFGVPIPAVIDSKGGVQDGAVNYTMQGQDFPTVLYRLTAGTPAIHVDLVAASTNLTVSTKKARNLASKDEDEVSLNKRGIFSWIWGWLFGTDKNDTFQKFPVIGSVSEAEFVGRNSDGDAAANGYNSVALSPAQFVNGTAIPNGSYRLLIRALKITGDAKKNDDYEKWLSPIINIVKP